MLKLKLQYFGHLMQRVDSLEKTLMLGGLHCLDLQAEDQLTLRWHVGQPCGKASWESLVG